MPASKLNADLGHGLSEEANDRVLTAPLQKPRQVDDLALVIRAQREQILALHRERELQTRNLLKSQHVACAGRMATGISHELNKLAAAMTRQADRLTGQLESADAEADLSSLRQTAEQTAELTRQIQELSNDGLGNESICDLDDAVESLANPLRQLIPDRIQLVVKLNAKRVAVSAHLGQLAQMLTQLVLNARDAIPGDGVITLSTRPGPGDVLTVCDTGRGMDTDTAQRAFDPYFTTKTASMGLGLTALRQLANRLKGELSVDSAPGWGTSIGISLPVSGSGT